MATGERDSDEHRDARLHIATALVEAGADPDNRQHGCGGTPLHHTLAGGYIELVKFLLTAQADVNASNRYGASPPTRHRCPALGQSPILSRGPPACMRAGVHPLHIAVKREFTDCIEYLMTWELPLQKVKDELAWAVQYDLSRAVICLLTNGAPHGLRVLSPWTATIPRALSSWDFSLPLGYYVVMRGWQARARRVPSRAPTRTRPVPRPHIPLTYSGTLLPSPPYPLTPLPPYPSSRLYAPRCPLSISCSPRGGLSCRRR